MEKLGATSAAAMPWLYSYSHASSSLLVFQRRQYWCVDTNHGPISMLLLGKGAYSGKKWLEALKNVLLSRHEKYVNIYGQLILILQLLCKVA